MPAQAKTYRKSELSENEKGYFRHLGGKRFQLGREPARAKLSAARLEALFGIVVAEWGGEWDSATTAVALAVARGEQETTLPPNPAMSGAESYVHWVDRYAVSFASVIRVLPEQPEAYEQGKREVLRNRRESFRKVDIDYPHPVSVPDLPNQTLHKAIDAFCAYLQAAPLSLDWKRTKTGQAARLKCLPDLPLSQLTLSAMEAQVNYWANRPKVKNKDKRITRLTARNQLKELKDFWRWLNRAESFNWHRPDGWDEIKPKIVRLPEDTAAKLQSVQVSTFTLEELEILYRNATPLVRCFILLGLNCGFGTAEICSLTTDEIHLHQPHPNAKKLGIVSTGADSWIFRIRHKSGVYAEFKLWAETARYLEWAINRMRKITPNGKTVFVTARGNAFSAATKTGNKPCRIPNLWNNLFKTAQKEVPTLGKLSIKYLRKTAGDMVKQVSDGEIAGVFLSHGQPVQSDSLADVYTNRPFGKVFSALDKVGEVLEVVFLNTPA